MAEWISSAETAWREDDVQIGSVREEDFDLEHGRQVDRASFLEWLQQGARHHDAGEGGFPIAARVVSLLESKAPDSVSAHEARDDGYDAWNQIRAMAATAFDRSPLRAASSLELARLAVLLHVEEVLKLELAPDLAIPEMMHTLRAMDQREWAEDLHMFCSELHLVQEQLRQEEPTETAGGVTEGGAQ